MDDRRTRVTGVKSLGVLGYAISALVITLALSGVGIAQVTQRGTGSGAVGGNVRQGPCSSLQIGGSNNQSTINCGAPLRVKEKAVALAGDISKFLAQQRKAGNAPSWEEFIGSFGDRIANVSDELASAGLGDSLLQQTNKLRVSGDIAGAEQQVADTFIELGTLLPQDGLYKDSSDVQLAHAITVQADKLDAMSSDTLKRLLENNKTNFTNPNFIRSDLFDDFNDCCRIAVKDLRGVALQRLPGAVEKNETRAFLDLMHMKPLGAWTPIHEYIPYLRHLAEELRTHP